MITTFISTNSENRPHGDTQLLAQKHADHTPDQNPVKLITSYPLLFPSPFKSHSYPAMSNCSDRPLRFQPAAENFLQNDGFAAIFLFGINPFAPTTDRPHAPPRAIIRALVAQCTCVKISSRCRRRVGLEKKYASFLKCTDVHSVLLTLSFNLWANPFVLLHILSRLG